MCRFVAVGCGSVDPTESSPCLVDKEKNGVKLSLLVFSFRIRVDIFQKIQIYEHYFFEID